jgi:hypothetical protein
MSAIQTHDLLPPPPTPRKASMAAGRKFAAEASMTSVNSFEKASARSFRCWEAKLQASERLGYMGGAWGQGGPAS